MTGSPSVSVSLQNKMTHLLLVCKAFHNLENSFISHKGFQFLTSLYEEKSTQLYHKIARWPITSWKCPFWFLFFFSGYCFPNSILLQLPGLLELEIYHVHLVIKCELTKKSKWKKIFFLGKRIACSSRLAKDGDDLKTTDPYARYWAQTHLCAGCVSL